MEGQKIISIACPSCGSNDIKHESDTGCICSHCGTRFNIELPKPNITYKTEVHVNADGRSIPIKKRVYTTVWDSKEFFRAAALDLAVDRRVPSDVLKSEFSEIRGMRQHFAEYQMEHEVEYKYCVKEYQTVESQSPGGKTLRETKSFYSAPKYGNDSINNKTGILVREDPITVSEIDDNFPPAMPGNEHMVKAKEIGKNNAEAKVRSKLPLGAEVEYPRFRTTISDVTAYVQHGYIANYKYKGKEFKIGAGSYDKKTLLIQKPDKRLKAKLDEVHIDKKNKAKMAVYDKNDMASENSKYASPEVKETVKKQIKPLKILTVVNWIAAIIAFGLLSNSNQAGSIICLALAIVVTILYIRAKNALKSCMIAEIQKQKADDLTQLFANKNLIPPTADEISAVYSEGSIDLASANKKVKIVKPFAIGSVIAIIALTIIFALTA